MCHALNKSPQPVSPEAISIEISRLAGPPLKRLRAAWAMEFSRDPPKALLRGLLLGTLARRLQGKAFGGHDRPTVDLLEAHKHHACRPFARQALSGDRPLPDASGGWADR
jgi:hypothetical protein